MREGKGGCERAGFGADARGSPPGVSIRLSGFCSHLQPQVAFGESERHGFGPDWRRAEALQESEGKRGSAAPVRKQRGHKAALGESGEADACLHRTAAAAGLRAFDWRRRKDDTVIAWRTAYMMFWACVKMLLRPCTRAERSGGET